MPGRVHTIHTAEQGKHLSVSAKRSRLAARVLLNMSHELMAALPRCQMRGGLHIQAAGGAVERVQHAAVAHQGNELA